MRNKEIRDLVFASIVIAIIVFLSVTMFGYIFYSEFAPPITILHIPVLVGAVVLGKRYGLILGATFGLFSMIMSFIHPTYYIVVNAPFTNPLLSVLPRAFFGFIIYPVYTLFNKITKNKTLATVLTMIISTLIHSLTVIPIYYYVIKNDFYFYASEYHSVFKDYTIVGLMLGIVSINGIIELIIAAVIGTPTVLVLDKLRNKYSEER